MKSVRRIDYESVIGEHLSFFSLPYLSIPNTIPRAIFPKSINAVFFFLNHKCISFRGHICFVQQCISSISQHNALPRINAL